MSAQPAPILVLSAHSEARRVAAALAAGALDVLPRRRCSPRGAPTAPRSGAASGCWPALA